MALVTTKDMFAKAIKSDYAIGAFNVNNMEIIQGKKSESHGQQKNVRCDKFYL